MGLDSTEDMTHDQVVKWMKNYKILENQQGVKDAIDDVSTQMQDVRSTFAGETRIPTVTDRKTSSSFSDSGTGAKPKLF